MPTTHPKAFIKELGKEALMPDPLPPPQKKSYPMFNALELFLDTVAISHMWPLGI